MSVNVIDLIGTIRLKDEFSGPIGRVAQTLGLGGQSFNAIIGLAAGAAAAIAGATAAIVSLGMHGADVDDVRGAFAGLAGGMAESDAMMQQLREGTLGTVSNLQLMQSTMGGVSAGVITSAEDMRILADTAKMVSDRTGMTVPDALEKMSTALGKGTVRGNDLKFMFEDSDVALRQYALSVGKNVEDLTKHERQTALARIALANMKKETEEAGPATVDFGDQVTRCKVAVQNFSDNVAVAIANSPVLAAGLDSVASAFGSAFGGTQEEQIQTIIGYVAKFAIGLTYVAQVGITAAQVLVTAWYILKTAILAVMTVITGFATGLLTIVSGAASLAASMPGATKAMKDHAVALTQAKNEAEAMTKSFAEQTAEAARGVVGNSDAARSLDELGGKVLLTRDAMDRASAASVDLAGKMDRTKKSHEEAAPAIAMTAEQMRAAEEAAMAEAGAIFEMGETVRAAIAETEASITALTSTSTDNRIAEITRERDARIALAQNSALYTMEESARAIELAQQEADIKMGIALGYYQGLRMEAEAAGFATIASQQSVADNAAQLFGEMVVSGDYSFGSLMTAGVNAYNAIRAAQGLAAVEGTALLQVQAQLASALYQEMAAAGTASAMELAEANMAAVAAQNAINEEVYARQNTRFTEVGIQAWGAASNHIQSLQAVAGAAEENYERIMASGAASSEEILASETARNEAERELNQATTDLRLSQMMTIASAATTIGRAIFGKNKTAAIAFALIDAALAIVKCFAQLGWYGFIPAAVIAAQTYAQIQMIRSQSSGFATGTPGTSFVDFGRGTMTMLHGREAVVNEQQGQTLAQMLAGGGSGGADTVAELKALRDEQSQFRHELRFLIGGMPRMMRDAWQLSRV